MDESLWWMVAVGAVVLFVSIIIALTWLWRELQKLKNEVRTLAAQLQRSSDDLVGLCSAAIAVDKRLAANELQLNGVLGNITVAQEPPQPSFDEEPEPEHAQSQGYELAIDKIRQGASVDDLVKSCGLTRDEAVLLIRLHGKR